MNTLIIQHVPGDEPRFCIVRKRDGKRAGDPAAIRSPRGFPVEGRPDSDLLHELPWYLEEFLGYPFPPETDRTAMADGMPEHVQEALAASVPFPSRLGKPEEFADLAAHIMENTYLNGETIRLDGAVRLAPK